MFKISAFHQSQALRHHHAIQTGTILTKYDSVERMRPTTTLDATLILDIQYSMVLIPKASIKSKGEKLLTMLLVFGPQKSKSIIWWQRKSPRPVMSCCHDGMLTRHSRYLVRVMPDGRGVFTYFGYRKPASAILFLAGISLMITYYLFHLAWQTDNCPGISYRLALLAVAYHRRRDRFSCPRWNPLQTNLNIHWSPSRYRRSFNSPISLSNPIVHHETHSRCRRCRSLVGYLHHGSYISPIMRKKRVHIAQALLLR